MANQHQQAYLPI